MQQYLARIGPVRMSGQEREQRVLHEREIDGLVIEIDLIGREVDDEVIDMKNVVEVEGVVISHKATRTCLELRGTRRRADEVGAGVRGQAQRRKGLVVYDHEHRDAAAVLEPFRDLVDAVVANAIPIEHQQVKIVCRVRRIGSRQAHLHTQRLGEGPGKLVEPRCPGHKQNALLGHAAPPNALLYLTVKHLPLAAQMRIAARRRGLKTLPAALRASAGPCLVAKTFNWPARQHAQLHGGHKVVTAQPPELR